MQYCFLVWKESIEFTKDIFSIRDVHNDLIEISDAFFPVKNLNFEGFSQYIGPSGMFYSVRYP